MKVYLYDLKTGVYEGEAFEEAVTLQHEEGLTTVPPPEYEHGQVPVFDCRKNVWTVIPASIVKQLIYGVEGMVAPFVGIKLIDMVIGLRV